MPDLTSFWISLRVAITSTIIVTILGIFVSKWLYNKKGHWVKILESFIILPIVLPPTVLGFILLIVFSTKGPIGQFFTNILHLPVVFTFDCISQFYIQNLLVHYLFQHNSILV